MERPNPMMVHAARVITPIERPDAHRKKRRKVDETWPDTLARAHAAASADPALPIGGNDAAGRGGEAWDKPPEPPADVERLTIETEADFERTIESIKKMADVPERLMESHLNVFLDPAPPGRMLSAKG